VDEGLLDIFFNGGEIDCYISGDNIDGVLVVKGTKRKKLKTLGESSQVGKWWNSFFKCGPVRKWEGAQRRC
jgi:hypothetical protein